MFRLRFRNATLALLVASAALSAFVVTTISADDRELFQRSNSKPYVFFVLDTSGSMNWRLNNDNSPPAAMDDPNSKMYQAKRALYEVLQSAGDSIQYGWGHFDAAGTVVRRKYHLYKPVNDPPWANHSDLDVILPQGIATVFGERRTGYDTSVGGDYEVHNGFEWIRYGRCNSEYTDEDDIHDFPKLDSNGQLDTVFYWRDGSDRYRIWFRGLTGGQEFGNGNVTVNVEIYEKDGSCRREDNTGSNHELNGDYDLLYDADIEFEPYYDNDGIAPALTLQPYSDYISRDRSGGGEFDLDSYYNQDNGCGTGGWDGNYDDDASDGRLTYDRTNDPFSPSRGWTLSRGDVVPWEWKEDLWPISNRREILYRLAPNLSPCRLPDGDPDRAFCETDPDFRVGRYFENERNGLRLPLKDIYEDYPPMLGLHSTPLAGSMYSFADWHDDWKDEARDADTGDPSYDCRQRYLVVISDGRDTCPGYECDAASAVYDEDVRTFIVGYALSGADQDSMQCIANNGGTGAFDLDGDGEPDGDGPIFVDNPQDLVDALTNVLLSIQSEATTVSAAAVPSVQADVTDKIFLTQFTPIDDVSVWPGRLQSFVKPVPLDDDGEPDAGETCDPADLDDSACLAWEAGAVVVDKQYNALDSNWTPVGEDDDQRRIYYSEFQEATVDGGSVILGGSVPAKRHYWKEHAVPLEVPVAQVIDFLQGHGAEISFAGLDEVNTTVDRHLTLREETLPNGDVERYLIGDFFHSDPLLIDGPGNTTYFSADLQGDPAVNCEQGDPNSYRCFALTHKRRRKMIAVGSNDGMLHIFDAGNFHLDDEPNPTNDGQFDVGTGKEIFAYMPRHVMPTVKQMVYDAPTEHQFTVDGSPAAGDVFIDPVHGGRGSSDEPDADDRMWRTVILTGLRRGGAMSDDLVAPAAVDPTTLQEASGYFLLDITQPDVVEGLDSYGDEFPDTDELVDTWVPDVSDTEATPECLGDGEGAGFDAECGPIAFGTPYWEFNDTLSGTTAGGDTILGIRLDEDDNGYVDLAPTWSNPFIGRIQVCTGMACDLESPDPEDQEDLEDRYVAVFGGGIDPDYPDLRGNYIYMVDVETGLTIYKRPVEGSVPSPLVLTQTRDGYLERLYFGTTLGFLYRVDLRPQILGTVRIPEITSQDITEHVTLAGLGLTNEPVTVSVDRIHDSADPTDRIWDPVMIFNANSGSVDDVIDGLVTPRPIYLEPAVYFLLERSLNGIVFGTGDREDLFEIDGPTGRLFNFVDDLDGDDLIALTTPFDQDDLADVTDDEFDPDNLQDLISEDGDRGWWMELEPDERLVGKPFVLSGVLFFSTFEPRDLPTVEEGLCQTFGTARIYGVFVTGGDPVLFDDGDRTRFLDTTGLVTAPFAIQYGTKNKPKSSGSGSGLTADQETILKELKKLFPENCSFPPAARVDIAVQRASTGIVIVAPTPQCVLIGGWQEE